MNGDDLKYLVLNFVIIISFISSSLIASETRNYRKYSDLLPSLQLPNKCIKQLKKIYKKGKSLHSDIIADNSISLEEWLAQAPSNRYALNGYDFYHYTDFNIGKFLHLEIEDRAQAEELIRQEMTYANVFDYAKKKQLNRCCGATFDAGIYIAEDERSSRRFGNLLWKIQLAPSTKIISTQYWDGELDIDDIHDYANWDDVKKEIETKLSRRLVKLCGFNLLKPLILEDSGIDLVSYSRNELEPWFIILNSRSITQSSFGSKRTFWEYTNH